MRDQVKKKGENEEAKAETCTGGNRCEANLGRVERKTQRAE